MIITLHELRRGWKALAIWTASIAFFVAICICMYPEMDEQMESVGDMFASMGGFTAAFGMDRLNFGTLVGFYAIECGNILGIGGAFFAAMTAANLLSGEEKERTAEFLLTCPVSRSRVVSGKLLSLLLQIVILNVLVYLTAAASVAGIGYDIPWKELTLLHLANFLVQVVLAGICFGISAFSSRSCMGAAMGIAICAYFANILANLTEKARWLKYLTPFAAAEGADILEDGALNGAYAAVGLAAAAVMIAAAYRHYSRKDIR